MIDVTLPQFFGVVGIWIAVPSAEPLAIFVSFGFLLKNRKEYRFPSKPPDSQKSANG